MRTRILLLAASLAAATSAFSQITVFSDGFQGETGTGLNYTNFVNWNVADGTVDLLGSGGNPGRWVDLDGSTGNAGSFSTKSSFNFEAGVVYTLSFDYWSTGGTNNATATIGSFQVPFTRSSGTPIALSAPFSFASATSASLVFQDLGNDNVGMGIDNVLITSPVPEPATLAALGLGAAALLRRRRRS